jgi:hypothetical protein
MEVFPRRLGPAEFARGQPIHCFQVRVPGIYAGLDIPLEGSDLRCLVRQLNARFAFPERRFGPLTVADVHPEFHAGVAAERAAGEKQNQRIRAPGAFDYPFESANFLGQP